MKSYPEYTPIVTVDGESVQLGIREFARATAKAMSAEGVLDDYIQSTTESKIQWAEQNIHKVAQHVDRRSWQERLIDFWITSLSEWKLFYTGRRLANRKQHTNLQLQSQTSDRCNDI